MQNFKDRAKAVLRFFKVMAYVFMVARVVVAVIYRVHQLNKSSVQETTL